MAKRQRTRSETSEEWTRIHKSGYNSTYAPREVDEKVITQLLTERDAAKSKKNYSDADGCAAELVNMDICFNDDKHEWYTRVLGSGKGIDGTKTTKVAKKKTKIKTTPKPTEERTTAFNMGANKAKRKYKGKNHAANERKKKARGYQNERTKQARGY